MFDWRPRYRDNHRMRARRNWCRAHPQRIAAILWGAMLSLDLLVLPLMAAEVAKAEPEAGLKARGQAFWEARIKEDYAAQYNLLEPKVQRQMTLTNYIQTQGPLQYLEARIEGVKIDEARAVLTVRTIVRIKYPPLDKQTQGMIVREEWVKRQGEWYRLHPQSS